ncbi:MAG: efflux RND transporter permease subunit [Kiritimatiellia bacterium]
MFLATASTRRPIAMSVLIIMLSFFGILSIKKLGNDLLPSVDVPFVTISVTYAGASPDELETAVTRKIEDAVAQVEGIRHITSTCLNNFTQILIEFNLDRDVDVAATDVREKVDLILDDLPAGADKPEILKFDVNATPVVTLALKGSLPIDELYDYADDKLSDRFASLKGVASVDLIGGMERQVIVDVDRDQLAVRGLAMSNIIAALNQENVKIPVGQIDDYRRELSLTFDAEPDQLENLGEIQIGTVRGQRIYLRDVATFQFGTERKTSISFYDGEPCVVMKVTKKGDANAASVVNLVQNVVATVKDTLPGGMELVWFRDDGTYINATVNDGLSSVWQGILLTGIVLLLFLADIRTAFVAFVSIPVTMIIALIVFQFFGYTFNIITMSAAGISVGILVANSIVVLENIALAFDKKKGVPFDVAETVSSATGYVALAVAASALTNIVVFLPITTMQSISGRFLAPFAVTVTAATFASLLISFTLTPILAMVTQNWGTKHVNPFLVRMLTPWNWFYKHIERGYVRSIKSIARAPWVFVGVSTVLTVLGFMYFPKHVQLDFVPETDQGDMTVKLEYPADYNISHTVVRTQAIAQQIQKAEKSVEHLIVNCGKVQGSIGQVSEGSYLAEINLRLIPMTERPTDKLIDIRNRVRAILAAEPDCISSVLIPSAAGGASQDITQYISGSDLDALNEIGLRVSKGFSADPASVDVTNSIRPGRPEVRFLPNRSVLHDMGIPSASLGQSLRGNVAGIEETTYKKGDRSYKIRARYSQMEGQAQIADMNFPGPDGTPIALGAVAEITDNLQPTMIMRYEKMRTVVLYANAAKGYGLGTALATEAKIIQENLPLGYTSVVGGMAEKMQETFEEFGSVSIIAIVLTYLLLCALMESWTQPFIILLTVPFSYLGLYMALWITNTTLSMFGLLAGIMLVGVVVNAAILLIDEVNTLRKRSGITKHIALMRAAKSKFRPILMSCVAALFGMLPMATGTGLGSEMRASIGIGSVGGIILSSVMALYFIPAAYLIMGRRDRKPAADPMVIDPK